VPVLLWPWSSYRPTATQPSALSVTVTVHVADCETTTLEPQSTDTVVVRRVTNSVPDPLASACMGSPP
jgi:hypothetical protein